MRHSLAPGEACAVYGQQRGQRSNMDLPRRLTQSFRCPTSAVPAFSGSLLHPQRHPIKSGQALTFQVGFPEPPSHRSDGPRSPASPCAPTCSSPPSPCRRRPSSCTLRIPAPVGPSEDFGQGCSSTSSSICSASTPHSAPAPSPWKPSGGRRVAWQHKHPAGPRC